MDQSQRRWQPQPRARFSPSSRSYLNHTLVKLESAGPEEEIDDAPFVWLQPVQLDRRERADVQAVNVGGVEQGPLKRLVLRDGRANECPPDGIQHFGLRTFHDRRK